MNANGLPLLALLSATGCVTPADHASLVRDSAGVRIVVSNSGAWTKADRWTVAQTPSVSIGTVSGDPVYELSGVTGAVRLDDGRFVVVNAGTSELRLYDPNGSYLGSFGRDGEGPGEFRRPAAVLPFADSLLVWDSRLRRMSVFTTAGRFVRSFRIESAGFTLAGRFADGSLLMHPRLLRPTLEMGDGLRRDLAPYVLYSMDGDSVGAFTWLGAEVIIRLFEGGGISAATRSLNRQTYAAVTDTSVFVGSNEAYVIEEYARDGQLLRSLQRPIAATPVTDARVAREAEAIALRLPEERRASFRQNWQDMPQPSALPFYSGLNISADGHLWVKKFSSLGDPNDTWSVFDPSGRLLGQVELPEGLTLYQVGDDYVLGRWRDDLDVEYIVMYELVKPQR